MNFQQDYDEWLFNLAEKWLANYGDYQKLIRYLHGRKFKVLIRNDENRAEDGKELRARFVESREDYTYRDMYSMDKQPCSVLEMMIALAMRIEDHIVWDPSEGDRTEKWFYIMLQNLHLDTMDDNHYDPYIVEHIVSIFLDRRYRWNGDGGLFVVNNHKENMRDQEIWYQMNWYLEEQHYI